jgi:predicted flap endonuclease-1-like 5' DNA nuclease
VISWYDNEWGYSCRVADLVEYLGKKLPKAKPRKAKRKKAVKPDDLKVIEGIGPKIAAALNKAGIRTFAELSKSSPKDLQAILNQANLSFAPSITSWAQQAGLLAKGDVKGFEALTEKLVAGRK